MSVTLGSVQLPDLLAHPARWDATNTRKGRVARSWDVRGLCKADKAEQIYSAFSTWRTARLADPIPTSRTDLGTTVSFSATITGGGAVSGLAVWFSEPPRMEKLGGYFDVSFSVVDAAQAREVEDKDVEDERPDLGNFTWGGVTLKLLSPPESYQSLPVPELTASGTSYYTGPLKAVKKRTVSGETTATGWATIQSYIESNAISPPKTGWWVLSPPTATAELRGGYVRYTVNLELVELQ